jgi:hypothetical protein
MGPIRSHIIRSEHHSGADERGERIYDRFNARDIDGVLTVLTDDVAWATVWMVATSMAARPYASIGRASGPWPVRTSSLWAFIELRMARSSQRSGSRSAISKANRSRADARA